MLLSCRHRGEHIEALEVNNLSERWDGPALEGSSYGSSQQGHDCRGNTTEVSHVEDRRIGSSSSPKYRLVT